MSFSEAGLYSGLGAGLSQMGSNIVQFSLEDARRQQQENLLRLQKKWKDEQWEKQTKHDDEVNEVKKLEQIIGYAEDGSPVTRGQYEGGQYDGQLYSTAMKRKDPSSGRYGGKDTAAMQNYNFLIDQGTPKDEAMRLAFGAKKDQGYDNGDIEKSLKITQQVLGDKWKPGDKIPTGKLSTINKARANAGLQPLSESSERDATWWLPESMEGTRYNYDSAPEQMTGLSGAAVATDKGSKAPQLKQRKPLTAFATGGR